MKVSEFAVGSRARCPACYQIIVISEENTADPAGPGAPPPRPQKYDWAAETPSDREGVGGQQNCLSCGRKFRGPWDRYTTAEGMICHICANSADKVFNPDVPKPEPEVAPPPTFTALRKKEEPAVQTEPQKRTLLDQFDDLKESSGFRVALYLAAFSVMGIGLFYTVIAPEPAPRPHPQSLQETGTDSTVPSDKIGLGLFGPPQELTKDAHVAIAYLFFALEFLFAWLEFAAALMILLAITNRLPHYSFLRNVLHVALVSFVAFSVLLAAYLGIMALLGGIPLAPQLVMALCGITVLLTVFSVYDLELWHLFLLPLCASCVPLLFYPVRLGVYGLLGLLVL
ncbi:MAG: hypothetical protein QG656_1872 [Candidatus Hydrogenedentes bacterium]|nr:hypothetical protein [Candidatus Hydrogenedentota bacterium]